jgi:hypothetical protein
MQVRANSVVPVSAAVVCEPLVGTLPLQPPEAVQLLASSACQLRMVVVPAVSVVACATRLTEGAGVVTVTSADCVDAPPGPVQASMNVVVELSASIVADPLTGFVPLQPPLAAQESAPTALQARVVAAPIATRLGLGCRLMTGPLALVELAPGLPLLSELPKPWQAASTAKMKQLIESLAYRHRTTLRWAETGEFGCRSTSTPMHRLACCLHRSREPILSNLPVAQSQSNKTRTAIAHHRDST